MLPPVVLPPSVVTTLFASTVPLVDVTHVEIIASVTKVLLIQAIYQVEEPSTWIPLFAAVSLLVSLVIEGKYL